MVSRLIKNRRIQYGVIVILIILTLVTLAQVYRKAYRRGGYDFTCYLTATKAFWNGQNPYLAPNSFPFIYPLFFAFSLYPLAILPYWLANVLWFLLNLLALGVSVRICLGWMRKIIPWDDPRAAIAPVFFVIIAMFSVLQNHFLNGQVNLLVLLLCLLFFTFQQENKPIASGVMLALAILIKLVPAIFLLYLVLRKQYRILAVTGLGILVGILLPYLVAGNTIFEFYRGYVNTFLLPGLTGVDTAQKTRVCFTIKGLVKSIWPAYGRHIIVTLISVGVPFVTLLWVERSALSKNLAAPFQFQYFGVYFPIMLLMSPMSETHHLVYLLPVVMLVIFALIFMPDARDAISLAGGIIFLLLFVVVGKTFQRGPGYLLAIVTLLVLHLRVLHRIRYHIPKLVTHLKRSRD